MELVLTDSNPTQPSIQPSIVEGDSFLRYREEVNTYYLALKTLSDIEPVEAFRLLSAFSARASELKTRLHRVDSIKANSFRTREIEPLLEEIDRQFKIHSRIHSCLEFEMKLSGERGLT